MNAARVDDGARLREELADARSVIVQLQRELERPCRVLEELLDDGFLLVEGSSVGIRNFVEAQRRHGGSSSSSSSLSEYTAPRPSAASSSAERMRRYRARHSEKTAATVSPSRDVTGNAKGVTRDRLGDAGGDGHRDGEVTRHVTRSVEIEIDPRSPPTPRPSLRRASPSAPIPPD